MALALIENIQREDLNPVEEARAYQRLGERDDLPPSEIGRMVGKSRSHVVNMQRLLALPQAVLEHVEGGRLSMGHARALLTLAPQAAIALARQAADNGWSVREVEHRVQQLAAGKLPAGNGAKARAAKAKPQADIATLERELSESLGTRVYGLHGRAGKVRLVIHYPDLDVLDGVLEILRGTSG